MIDSAAAHLERGAGHALWRQIAQRLEREIVRGAPPAGQRLATETELAGRFAVNRHTVRRAIGELVARGLLRVEHGRGIFVQRHVIDYAVGRRTRFSENIARARGAPGGRLLRAGIAAADAAEAEALGLRVGAAVVVIERVGEADGRPVNIGRHAFSAARFPGLVGAYEETGSITEALAQEGLPDYVRRTTRVTARMPTPEEARLLEQPESRPVLQTESLNVDSAGGPVEYGLCCFAADRVQLLLEPEGR